jgi:hypothetical protein
MIFGRFNLNDSRNASQLECASTYTTNGGGSLILRQHAINEKYVSFLDSSCPLYQFIYEAIVGDSLGPRQTVIPSGGVDSRAQRFAQWPVR